MVDTIKPGGAVQKSELAQDGRSDEQLMIAFGQGSGDAFSELFSRYKQPLLGFFCRRLADAGQAEELAQETFLALLRAASSYEPRASFRTYLYAIALKILRAHRRKAAVRAMLFRAHREIPKTSEPARDTEIFLREAVRKLEPKDREIVLLREFEQLSYEEIAKVLGLPMNTVRSRLFRARTALRDLLHSTSPASLSAGLAESEEPV